MAMPIDRNTIQTYDTYTIKIDDNNDNNIPLNAFYLVPYLKNDNNEKSKYENSNAIPIKNHTFYTLGDCNFDVTINVENHIMTADEFVNRVLFVKYPTLRDHERITSILSILPCTKALYLGVLCVLFNSGDYPDDGEDPILDRIQFLADLRDLKQIDVYNFVMGELLKMINNQNPINAEDYYPKIEYEELTDPYDEVNEHIITAGSEFAIGSNYENVIKIKSNSFNVDDNEISRAKESFMNVDRLFINQVGENKPIIKYEVKGTDNEDGPEQERILTIQEFPSSLLSINKNLITNTTQHCFITFPAGFRFWCAAKARPPYRMSEERRLENYSYAVNYPITLGPGGSIRIPFLIYDIQSKSRDYGAVVGETPQQIEVKQAMVEWDYELDYDNDHNYIMQDKKKSRNSVKLKNIRDIQFLYSDSNLHTITNTTKSLKITIPKGTKYHVEGEKTTQILRTRVIREIITVVVKIVTQITSAIKSVWKVITGQKTITEAREEYRQEVKERTEAWYESQIIRLSKNYEIDHDVVLLPGESYKLPTPSSDSANTFKNQMYIISGSTVKITKNYKYSQDVLYNNNIKITANIVDDPESLEDNVEFKKDNSVELKVPMEFRNTAENRCLELADGKLSFRQKNVAMAKRYSNYKNILTTKKPGSLFLAIINSLSNTLGISNMINGTGLKYESEGELFKGEGPNKIYFEYTPTSSGTRKYGLAKTVDGIDQSLGINIPTTFGKLSSSNNFGLMKKQKITITVDKNQFEEVMRADILRNIRQLTDGLSPVEGLEENVIYHVNKINVTPDVMIEFHSEELDDEKYKSSVTDVDFLLNKQNSQFVFKIGSDFTINYSGDISVSMETGQSIGLKWYWILPLPVLNTHYVKTISPIGVSSKYTLDVSSLNLYYYNGTIYVK